MKTCKQLFLRLLDRLSGTYPNDERISRINEKGFALCGLFYIFVMAYRSVQVLTANTWYVNSHLEPALLAPVFLAVMLLMILGIAVKQRRKETPVQKKAKIKWGLKELPRAAAALLSGKSPEDERTVQAFECGFAVCGLLGILYFAICMLFVLWSRYLYSTLLLLFAAPLLLGYVKMRENIMTPPRLVHIPLSIKHPLLRLPVYVLAVLPFLFMDSYTMSLGSGWSNADFCTDNLLIMFFQVLWKNLKEWICSPLVTAQSLKYCALIFLFVALIYEIKVEFYQKQMEKMDAEENDLS